MPDERGNSRPPVVEFQPDRDILIWLVQSRQGEERLSDTINRKLRGIMELEEQQPTEPTEILPEPQLEADESKVIHIEAFLRRQGEESPDSP
ncbi:MAG: hypothetical protein HC919_13675 [Oscillatoriales cyanobacterium SM2_2_1]|nr:hypothetical protein [Oscillatoriales cyanobacterium SM2_2_1]